MSKAVLISIQPKWCDLIAYGNKTVEVRKTYPRLQTPFKCYIYCTKPYTASTEDRFYIYVPPHDTPKRVNGKVIGEFTCSQICAVLAHPAIFAGKPMFFQHAIDAACLTQDEVETYGGDKDVYGWVIEDLKIYDTPKELGEFKHTGRNYHFAPPVTKPPQSWCYVEEVETDCHAASGGSQ